MSKASWVVPAITTGIGLYNQYRGSRTNQTRRRKMNLEDNVGACTYTKRKYRTGRYRRRSSNRVFREAIALYGNKNVWRWQQCSPSLIGPGNLPIGWANLQTNVSTWMPMMFMSLTQNPYGPVDNQHGCWVSGLKHLYYNYTNGDWNAYEHVSQDFTGAQGPNGDWHIEQEDGTSLHYTSKMFHRWTDLRLNLYGARSIPITYTIYLMQVPQQLDFQAPGNLVAGTECANMLKDMVRPLCGNPIAQNGRIDWPKDVRIVKKIVHTIQPLNYSDQSATGSSNTKNAHVRQVKWFLRHDRLRDYKWHQNASETNADRDLREVGWDVVKAGLDMSDVEWGKRLYLFITCTAPQVNATQPQVTQVDQNWMELMGSLDILCRQCWDI